MRKMFVVVLAPIFSIGLVHAQIPVTDGASIANRIEQQVETMAKWKMQFDQMKAQIEQMKQQYESITGTRNLGDILNNPALREYLPEDWQGVYDAVKNSGVAGLSGQAKTIYEENKIYDACAHLRVREARTACEAQAVKGAQDKASALAAYDKTKERLKQIDQLMGRINTTEDPKAIAELQGRIAAEQAMIQNEQTKLQLYKMISDAEERLQDQRERELIAKDGAKRGWIKPKVPNFN